VLRTPNLVGIIILATAAAVLVRADEPYTIAYTTFAPVNTAIFVANPDGSGERMLVGSATADANPSFSRDGRWVLFTSKRRGSADIYRVRLDGTGLERLTDDVAFDDQAVMTPDGRRIAFVSSRTGQADIWTLDLQTRQLRNLTRHPGGDYRPAFSPDGEWIAFTSDRNSDGARAKTGFQFAPLQLTQIYVMRADGSDVRRITSGEAAVGGASWSPDGTALAFFEAAPADWLILGRTFPSQVVASQIGRVDLASGVRTLLTTGSGRKLTPQWHADGRIAYVRSDTDEKPGQGFRRNDYWSERIRFVDGTEGPVGIFGAVRWSADGRQIVFHRAIENTPRPVVPEFSRDARFKLVRTGAFPSFSPDGRRLAATDSGYRVGAYEYANPQTKLFTMNVDGSDRRVLFESPSAPALGPVWSPDGRRIAFGVGVNQPRPGRFGPAQVALVSPDGTGFRRLTPDDEGNYQFPSWSPDGKRLVLRVANPTTKGLSILDVESGRLTPLTPDSGSDNLPAWSPTGELIAFTSNRDGDWEIYTIRPDGAGLTRLTQSPGNDAHAAWSPDARWLAFSSARGGFKDEMARGGGGQAATDIFVMRADGSEVRRLTDDAAEEGTVAFAWK
jgi:Tol biopolymer transport system component